MATPPSGVPCFTKQFTFIKAPYQGTSVTALVTSPWECKVCLVVWKGRWEPIWIAFEAASVNEISFTVWQQMEDGIIPLKGEWWDPFFLFCCLWEQEKSKSKSKWKVCFVGNLKCLASQIFWVCSSFFPWLPRLCLLVSYRHFFPFTFSLPVWLAVYGRQWALHKS